MKKSPSGSVRGFQPGLVPNPQVHVGKKGRFANLVIVVLFALSTVAATESFVPHRSPEFKISEPSGKSTLLSTLRGKVVVKEFFFLQSNHCTRIARMLNKLNVELGPRGFTALGVVFDPPNAPESHGELVGPAAIPVWRTKTASAG